MPSHYHLAQINVGRTITPLDSPGMADFVAQLPVVNALADLSPGLIWRLQAATDVQAFADPLVLVNMSVWQSFEDVQHFTYANSHHLGDLRNRAKWFERSTELPRALWWIPAGHVPTVTEAVDRLQFRRTHGDTPLAFSFAQPFPRPD